MQEKNENTYCPKYKWNSYDVFENKTDSDDFEDEIFKYAKENIAYITLFINEAFAEKIMISEKISRISFMSDVGGLLGLFMGFSFVSAVEILYHGIMVSMGTGHAETTNGT